MSRWERELMAGLLVVASGCRSILGFEEPVAGDAGTGVDTVADAASCFGQAPFEICLTSLPTGPVNYSAANASDVIDTDGDDCTTVVGDASDMASWCVIAGTSIRVSGRVLVTGSRPLVLLATGVLLVPGTLDAASHTESDGTRAGPGAETSCGTLSVSPSDGSGLAGGSLGTVGGTGGAGGDTASGEAALPALMEAPVSLRGGCPGGSVDEASQARGGGAIYLLGGLELQVDGTINASGAGGRGGAVSRGGSGGGSGGLIVLWSPQIGVGGSVFANGGGGGGGGGGNNNSGFDGAEPMSATEQAAGGVSTIGGGGGGGDGAASLYANGTIVETSGGAGGAAFEFGRGGGGGGGGLGWIRLMGDPEPSIGGTMSPQPTD